MKKLYILLLAITFLYALSMLACNRDDEGRNARERNPFEGERVVNISAITVRPTSISEVIRIGGGLEAINTVSVTPDTRGVLSRILVKEGTRVRRDQVIAYVDPSLSGQNFLLSPVKTPIAGIIASLPTDLGNTVSTQHVIATVVDNSELEVRITIPEQYVSKIDEDTVGYLQVISLADEVFALEVKSLSSVISPVTHTMAVTMSVTQQDDRLKSGMYGNVELVLTEKENVLVVDRNVMVARIIDGVDKIGVYLVHTKEDGATVAQFSEVQTGIENQDKLEVVSGLQEDDILIVQGQETLLEGSLVKIFDLDGEPLMSSETSENAPDMQGQSENDK